VIKINVNNVFYIYANKSDGTAFSSVAAELYHFPQIREDQ